MQVIEVTGVRSSERGPWNKGKLTGQKPPLQPKHVWAIRTRLQLAKRTRDLALFNLAIDSKLRGCDVVSLRSEDVAPHGYAIDRSTVRQKKTRRSDTLVSRSMTRWQYPSRLKSDHRGRAEALCPTANRRKIAAVRDQTQQALLTRYSGQSLWLAPRLRAKGGAS